MYLEQIRRCKIGNLEDRQTYLSNQNTYQFFNKLQIGEKNSIDYKKIEQLKILNPEKQEGALQRFYFSDNNEVHYHTQDFQELLGAVQCSIIEKGISIFIA